MRISPLFGGAGALEARRTQVIQTGQTRPLIIGHRGAAGHAPENTQAAFRAAIQLGVDAVEFDVQFSADGEPLVFHDETLGRMAGVPARIPDYPAAALKGFDIGFRHGDQYRGERIPSVAEVADLVPPAIGLHAEVKDYEPVSEPRLERLIEELEGHGGLERVIFSSPHEETLAQIQKLRPSASLALLLFKAVKVPTDAARRASLLGCRAVNPDARLVSPELAQVCQRHHMQLFTFTVNERGTMRKLEQIGVNGFFTDYPDRLMEAAR